MWRREFEISTHRKQLKTASCRRQRHTFFHLGIRLVQQILSESVWVGLFNHMCVFIYIVLKNMHTSINIHIYTYIQYTYAYTYVHICYLVATREK